MSRPQLPYTDFMTRRFGTVAAQSLLRSGRLDRVTVWAFEETSSK